MRAKQLLTLALLLSILCIQGPPQSRAAVDPKSWSIKLTPELGTIYPNFERQFAVLVVDFAGGKPNPDTFRYLHDLDLAVDNGWDCSSAKNFRVTHKSKRPDDKADYPVRIALIDTTSTSLTSCAVFRGKTGTPGTHIIRLQIDGPVEYGVEYDVEVLNLGIRDSQGNPLAIKSNGGTVPPPDKDKGKGVPNSFDPSSNPKAVSATAQSVLSEPLTDGTYKGVEQLVLTSTFPIAPGLGKGAAFYVNTKDLFSTNERDKKSAFLAGAGWEWGPQSWYLPIKLEGDVQGNQVATNLSTVVSLSAATVLPWGGTSRILDNRLFELPLSPDFTVALPYTHRINQNMTGKAKPLPVDDFSVNPALALKNGVLFPNRYCDPNTVTAKRLVCFGLEADLGMYYLPLETTSKGSQRSEGYGDVSFLVPLSDFSHFPFITFDSQSLASQIRIEYSDAVAPANNYARTKKWSFGIELIGAKK